MRFFKRNNHSLFVEEEHYEWAKPRRFSGPAMFLTTLILCGGVSLVLVTVS